MLESNEVDIDFNGKPAKLAVMRNNGYCWGRIRQDGQQFDVMTETDWYDLPDDEVEEACIQAAKDPTNVQPAVGWL